jgi:hypothetical protein
MNSFKLRIKNFSFFLIFLGVILLNSCEAPRENPLDPNSSDNLLGSIEGTVQTFSLPYTPIKNVEVIWRPGNILVYSDANGNFSIPNIKTENGPLIFRKEGYHTDTVQIDWAGERKLNEQINLNKIPELDSLSIYSVITNIVTPPSPMSKIVIDTKIADIDNDIDTVFVINDQTGLEKAMDFNLVSKTFYVELTPQDLNITDLEQSIGLEFDFRVRDILGEIYILKGGSVKRIINDSITGMQPANDSVVTSFPFYLKWKGFMSGYSFNYKLEIFTNDGSQSVQDTTISSDNTSFLVDSLDTGNYYWVIWIVDDFNDMNRSLPATFSVQ